MTLKYQVGTSREKRKELTDKLKEKEEQSVDNKSPQDKTNECEKLARENVVFKNDMQSVVMKLKKEIEDWKKNEQTLTHSLKNRSEECCRLTYENDNLKLELVHCKNDGQELERQILILSDDLSTANEYKQKFKASYAWLDKILESQRHEKDM